MGTPTAVNPSPANVSASPAASLTSSPSLGLSRSEVESIIDEKLRVYRRIAYAFLLGFTGLIIVLVANQLVSRQSLLVFIHDQLFGSERSLREAIDKSVALSYSEQFTLGTDDPVQYVSFYANETQKVIALVDVKHYGTGNRNKVLIKLDQMDELLYDKVDDLDFQKVDLTERVRKIGHFTSGAEHVHTLTFQLDPETRNPKDHTNIRLLANVVGLESNP